MNPENRLAERFPRAVESLRVGIEVEPIFLL
jgi:hypothetical protein